MMKKVRVCHIVNLITGNSDGVFAHLSMLARTMDRERYEHIVIFQGGGTVEQGLERFGVEVHTVPSLGDRWPFRAMVDVYRLLRRVNPDILHVHMMKPFVIVGLLNIVLRHPAIWNHHGSFIERIPYYSPLERWMYRCVTLFISVIGSFRMIVTPSNSSRRLLLMEASYLPEVAVYYNGVSEDATGAPDPGVAAAIEATGVSGKRVLVPARYEVQKRPDRAIRMISALHRRHPDAGFVFMGDGPLERQVKEMVEKEGADSGICCLGYVPNASSYMPYFSIVLLASDWEGMPLVMWEAMRSGVPFVSTDVGGIREIVEPSQCGAVFPREDEGAGIDLIDALLSDPERRAIMGRNGRAAAEERYSARMFAGRMDELYRMTLGAGGR